MSDVTFYHPFPGHVRAYLDPEGIYGEGKTEQEAELDLAWKMFEENEGQWLTQAREHGTECKAHPAVAYAEHIVATAWEFASKVAFAANILEEQDLPKTAAELRAEIATFRSTLADPQRSVGLGPTESPCLGGGYHFRKLPVVIEARQWDGTEDGAEALCRWANDPPHKGPDGEPWIDYTHGDGQPIDMQCHSLEGSHHVSVSDWIIRGVKGEFYACKPDIFAMTYEPASDPPRQGGAQEPVVTPLPAPYATCCGMDIFGAAAFCENCGKALQPHSPEPCQKWGQSC